MAHRCNGLTEDNGTIAAVLEQDRQIAVEAPKCNDLNDVDSATKRTYFIVGQMYRMDLSNCPDDFAQAYDNHRKAWQELLEVFYDTKRYQLRLGAGCLLVLFNGTSGRNSDFLWELDGEQKQLVKRYQDANRGIAETFDKVLGTATKHGVKTAQYRNPAFQ